MAVTDQVRQIIHGALAEDIGSGDVTSMPIIAKDVPLKGSFLVKAKGVIVGLDIVAEVFSQVDPTICFRPLVEEGSEVHPGHIVAEVSGYGPGILIAERTALNFLQRMSGIATLTRLYVQAVAGTRAHILDTRKTVPGLRVLDKHAVKLGGGMNHRIGLYDMVLIKDNHIQAAGSITRAVQMVRQQANKLPIEVEVESLEQLDEALSLQVDRIMLDNMDQATMREAVRRTQAYDGLKPELEASGGVTLDTVAAVAGTGVDLISVGALTHSVRALDISLDIVLDVPAQGEKQA
jgi:nicotinate-nucleotide pyrophosphorylase (carboxylating)